MRAAKWWKRCLRRVTYSGWGSKLGLRLLVGLLLFCGVLVGLEVLERRFEPTILLCAASEAQNAALARMGEAVERALAEVGAGYEDIITLERNTDGSVTACRTDTVLVNRIRRAVVTALENYFLTDGADISFPVGNIFGGGLLYARGPGISFRVLPVGRITCDYRSSYESAGINQTRHQLALELSLVISVLGARQSEEVSVEGSFPIAETIIIGYVPEHYAGMAIQN